MAIDRFIGYKQALEYFQLSYDAKRVVVCDKGIRREGYTATAKLLQKDPTIDALPTQILWPLVLSIIYYA